MTGKKRILVFEAHGDDMEFTCGGTIAKFTERGYEVHLCVATDNDKGSFELTADELRAARDREVQGAARVLCVPGITCLGYPDGELMEKAPLHVLRGQFMRLIRQVRPDMIFTWDPFTPYEGHPDHRQVAWAAHEAASFAHFQLYCPEHLKEGLEPHYVGEEWFFAKSPRDVNKTVDISEQIDRKIDALCEHVCQMEMTVMEAQAAVAAAGVDVPFVRDADPGDYRPVIEAQIKAWAASVGKRAGFAYGEEFRRQRFGGLERWLPAGQRLPDDV